MSMNIEKKTVRSDIPGSHVFLNGNIGYVGSTADEARRLVVGRDISLNGQIDACSYLVIEGVVVADTFTARRMDILEAGLFSGAAEVQECVIAGRFEGRLTVAGRLTVKPSGQITGEISYGTLEVEAGARINGQITAVPPQAVEIPAPGAKAPDFNLGREAPVAFQDNFASDEYETPVASGRSGPNITLDAGTASDRVTAYRRAAQS